jgi:hypothetical protein
MDRNATDWIVFAAGGLSLAVALALTMSGALVAGVTTQTAAAAPGLTLPH